AATTTTTAPKTGGRNVTDPSDSVRNGDSGEGVKKIQEALVAAGYKLAVDGKFGNVTETAVKDFQKKNKLTVDGVVGPLTWKALEKAANP
ncbi:MAG TPA: peptidoglycan-binding domain-containing protein, partial [Ilumatobacteraceae bacterium]|nr:peptidoglycan-binding domain-containing protein [Ilumatobacteraceae bacterium]